MDFKTSFSYDVCDFHLCVQKNSNFHLLLCTFSYSPDNLLQFLNLLFIVMSINILIHNHLSLTNPQKHLSRFNFGMTTVPLP